MFYIERKTLTKSVFSWPSQNPFTYESDDENSGSLTAQMYNNIVLQYYFFKCELFVQLHSEILSPHYKAQGAQ